VRKHLDLARAAVEAARAAGAEFADASVGAGRAVEVEVEESLVKACSAHRGESVSVRAFFGGGRGTCVAHRAALRSVRRAGREAAAQARCASPDPDFRSLPAFEEAPDVPELYDARVARLGGRDVLRVAGDALERAREADGSAVLSGSVSASSSAGAFANSLGVAYERSDTNASAGFMAVVRAPGEVGSYYEFDAGRFLEDVELEAVGALAVGRAREFLGARSMPTGVRSVVFGPLAAHSLLASLVGAASAESVQRSRSFLADKLGTRVAARAITIRDDPTIARGLYSAARDGEGAPARPVTVIRDGELVTLLHNAYTAGKAGCANNGRGTMGGAVSATNFRPRLGARTMAEFVASIDDGLYVEEAALAPNSTSGDFSATVDFGFCIEKGKRTHPVANVMIAGNVLELLSNVEAVSSDCREEPGNLYPSLLVRGVQISGEG